MCVSGCKGRGSFGSAEVVFVSAEAIGRLKNAFFETRIRLTVFRSAEMKRETDLGLPKTPSRGTKPIKTF